MPSGWGIAVFNSTAPRLNGRYQKKQYWGKVLTPEKI